jgi:hypothetical protein
MEEFEELLIVLAKTALFSFEYFLEINLSARMDVKTHLQVAVAHVEKLADLPVLQLLPIFPLANLGTLSIQGGLACSVVLELSGDATALQMM